MPLAITVGDMRAGLIPSALYSWPWESTPQGFWGEHLGRQGIISIKQAKS
jgi:hypothetical protein